MSFINIPHYNWLPPVNLVSDLPSISNNIGDARAVIDTGAVYIWNGSIWETSTGGSGSTILTFIGTASAGDGVDPNRAVSVPGILATDTIVSVTPMTTTVASAWFYGLQGDDFGISGVSNDEIIIYCDPTILSGLYVVVSVIRA